jgi:uncharacterized membrane protein
MEASIGSDRSLFRIGLHALAFLGAIVIGEALLLPAASTAQTIDPSELVSVVIECGDGLDNDSDGRVDYPDDPDCADVDDEAERTPTPLPRTQGRLRKLPLPQLPKGIEVLQAWVSGVSGDGRVKTGALGVTGPAGGMEIAASVVWTGLRPRIIDEAFSQIGGPGVRYSAGAVSENGHWIAGQRGNWETGFRVYRWHAGALEELPALGAPGEWVGEMAHGVSNDGVVVGESDLKAARWDDQGAVFLDPIGTGSSMGSLALAITPDGRTTVGSANHAGDADDHAHASVWTGSDPNAVPLLAALESERSVAFDASNDGRVIVGTSHVLIGEAEIDGVAGFRWTQQGITWLGVPASVGEPRFLYWSTSDAGAISVGWIGVAYNQRKPSPVILAGGKLRTLVDLLENEYGVDLEGWDFSGEGYNHPSPVEISGDGRTIVGHAVPPGGTLPMPYQVRLPPRCSDGLDNDGDGRVDFTEDRGCSDPDDATEQDRREPRSTRRR